MTGRILAVLIAFGLLAGCAGHIAKHPNAESQGTPFTQALAQEYKALAAHERDQGDAKGGAHFERKALVAAVGTIVPLEDPANYALGDAAGNAASIQRSFSADPLGDVRDVMPAAAAKARVKFDCWVYESGKGAREEAAACRKEMIAAWDALLKYDLRGVIAEDGGDLTVYFNFDKATLTYAGQQVVNQMLWEARMFMPSSVAVIGYTDSAGSANYNLALGLRRANQVRDALIAGGIPASIITVASKGISDPALDTGPNVREARNRRVVIIPEL